MRKILKTKKTKIKTSLSLWCTGSKNKFERKALKALKKLWKIDRGKELII